MIFLSEISGSTMDFHLRKQVRGAAEIELNLREIELKVREISRIQ